MTDSQDGRKFVKVIDAALHETPSGEIVLRGIIDPDSLTLLRVDKYQREVLPQTKISALMSALQNDSVPDIELGMRGQDFQTRVYDGKECFYLIDPVYLVDGQQRTTAAKRLVELGCDPAPQLGATIHFGTNYDWERARFDKLNLNQTRLSPNVTLRNLADDLTVADMMLKLSKEKGFPLQGRITWTQNALRGELLTATGLFKTAGLLHSHLGPGRSSEVVSMANGLQKIMDNVGKQTFQANVRTYFDIIDECYGVKQVAFKQGATWLKHTFLSSLALVLSQHLDFWVGDKLVVETSIRRKLASFPTMDPQVISLSSSSGKSGEILYMLLVNHINSGKRTKRLKPRNGYPEMDETATVDPCPSEQ